MVGVVACTASPHHHSVSRSLMSACAASFFCSDTVATWSIEKCVICSRIFCAHKFNKKQFLKSMKKFNVETGTDREVSLYSLILPGLTFRFPMSLGSISESRIPTQKIKAQPMNVLVHVQSLSIAGATVHLEGKCRLQFWGIFLSTTRRS